MESCRTCVVLRTHFMDDDIYGKLYLPLRATLPETYHLVVAHDETRHPWPDGRFAVSDLLRSDEQSMRRYNPLHRDNWYSFDSFLGHVYRERGGFDY